ncbi:MAG: thiosulfohydrolase SoxB, partial [Aliifodinibius sp.]|nr:thiosulfohydrolase SoxB [Phycisphaerae bacterium]NIT56938.1 thiosulfohydrolase SoxB [Fodinibius sp.]NIY25521.1 thiosulfohydrolase SoxB [Fodinibius sp.]
QEIDRLRQEEGIEILILLSHMGYEQDRVMAGQLNGVDVIVGGHSHDILWQPEQIGKTLLLQGGSHGKFLGKLDLEISQGIVSGFDHELIPVLAERVEP